MNNEQTRVALDSRYVVRTALGEFPPWHGCLVSDSLSEKEYLFFSLEIPANLALSIDDLRMRDYLFAKSGAVATPALSLQQTNGSVTFLIPRVDLVPLTKALPLMKPARALAHVRVLLSYTLARLADGCAFSNLSLESMYMANDAPGILPTAYLVPGAILASIRSGSRDGAAEPPYGDLRAAADLLSTAARHFDPDAAERAKRVADALRTLGPETAGREYHAAIEALAAFAEAPVSADRIFPARVIRAHPPAAAIRAMKHIALKARDDERVLVFLRGAGGEGKTHFLEHIERILVDEWGYRCGAIAGDQSIFQDVAEKEAVDGADFALVDDHAQEPLLDCCVMDYLCQATERCRLTVAVVGGNGDAPIAAAIRDEIAKRGVDIREVDLPPLPPAERRRLLDRIGPGRDGGGTAPEAFALERLDRIAAIEAPGAAPEAGGRRFLESLASEDRSVLAFLAAFAFEAPLSFILAVYAPEERSVFDALRRLEARGLVRSRAGASALSNGALAVLYRLAGRSIAGEAIETLSAERRESIHRNVARLLDERRGVPAICTFVHLARSGARAEAALRGREILQHFMRRRRLAALRCLHTRYFEEGLDLALPADARYGFLLELGEHFSMTGNTGAAECFYRRCREEIDREPETARFRALAVEAARRESEILEKRGEFPAAQELLEQALETHGDKLLSRERAKLYNDMAWIQYRLGEFDRSWEHCLLVHRLLDEKRDPAEIAQSYNLMGTINWNRSKYEDAVLCYKRCLALREECGDEIGIASTYNNLGLVYRSLGAYAEALACFAKSMEIKKRHENLPGLAAAHLNQALVYLEVEKYRDAERSCATAAHLAETIGNQQLLAEAWGTMGEIQYLQGNGEKAAACYEKDLDLCDRTKSIRERAVVLRKLGELRLAAGDAADAARYLGEARALNRLIGSRLEAVLLSLLEGRMLISQGCVEDGRFKLESGSLELALLGRTNAAAGVAAELGSLSLAEGNEPLAREYLLRSLSAVGESEHVPLPVRLLRESVEKRSPLCRGQIVSDTDRFHALCRLTAMVRAARGTAEIESLVVDAALRITGMERSALLRKTDGRDAFRIAAASGDFAASGTLADRRILAVLAVALRLGYPLDTTRSTVPEGKVPPEFLAERPRILCVPLRLGGETTAFLYLDSSREGERTGDGDHSLLVAFCQEAALALERALLYERIEGFEQSRFEAGASVARTGKRAGFQDVIGSSAPMRHLYGLLDGIKDMDTTVLLTGSNGTGKDLIARTIHYRGPRAEKPFVSLNCAAISAELLESELFGHERGAFTGAHKLRIGHFESANGGTIFLNEIGDMPLALQPKLLHVLENRTFYRVGGSHLISTNVRIITATNKDLLSLVREGRFREDLYYRVNVFPIRIPDLRERVEDIEPLALHFLATFCRLYGMPVKKISPEAMARLVAYDWPGNVRELENIVNRTIIATRRETILPEDLPDAIAKRREIVRAEERATLEQTIDELVERVELTAADPILPRVEGMIVSKVVEKIGDKTKAAALLGISKPTVYSKLKKYGKTGKS
jgi:transcriptional regulator with GAF, ATPase, and Fis domain/tetratricopeptide (TPR) repeat protein